MLLVVSTFFLLIAHFSLKERATTEKYISIALIVFYSIVIREFLDRLSEILKDM
jgi:hypothetical protein